MQGQCSEQEADSDGSDSVYDLVHDDVSLVAALHYCVGMVESYTHPVTCQPFVDL